MFRFLERKSKFWSKYSHFVVLTIGALGIVALAISATVTRDRFSIVSLSIVALVWLVFATLNQKSWRSSLRSWERTLDAWKETSDLVRDLTSLMDEALEDLSTYDREKAEDIGGRVTAVCVLRSQNIQERVERSGA